MTMVYPATDEIYKTMQEHNLKCGIEARDNSSALHIGITAESTGFEAMYISRSEKNDVALRIFNLVRFPEEKFGEMLKVVNECNNKFRFLKFSIDTDSYSIDAAFDFALESENLGECAYEMLMRSAGIIDQCYPEFMAVLKN
ncbi:MAG TPA: hypothetical protein DCP68_00695 [Ruminococcus sp.]|nr:hypothetical protein [Ruminococcus sp.]